jgi:MFS family permease
MQSFREVLSNKIDPGQVQALYIILFVYNFFHGLILGNFSGLLSLVKSTFNLSTGELGDALSTASVGAVIGLLFVPRLLVQQGSRTAAFYAAIFFFFTYTIMIIAAATSKYLGFFAMICMGLGIVWMTSALNTQAALMETIIGFPLFGRLQGTYSIGAIVGAVISAQLVDQGWEVWEILGFSTIVYVPAIFIVVFFLLGRDEEILVNQVRELEKDRLEALRKTRRSAGNSTISTVLNNVSTRNPTTTGETESDGEDSDYDSELENQNMLQTSSESSIRPRGNTSPTTQYGTVNQQQRADLNNSTTTTGAYILGWLFSKPPPPHADISTLFILGVIILLISFGESSVTYFSELYLEQWGVSETTAVMGFVAFQLGLAISRFLSDWVVMGMGRKVIMVGGNAIAGIGMGLVAVAGITYTTTTLALAVSGFIVVGLFEGPMLPVLLSFASNLKGFQPGDSIPMVTVFGICGLVIGPLVNGNMVDGFSYKSTFFIQALLMVIAAILAMLTKERYKLKRSKRRGSPPPVDGLNTTISNTMHSTEEVR